ncbi:MAG TPA: carboxypeptidase M32 [Kofleriaceae bacterium]|nr:carboxypeptidase M32 [Kofleriaceae bacterium]
MSAHPHYDQLAAAFQRIYRFEHLQALAAWDHATYMPPGGNDARSASMAELAALIHRLRTAAELGTEIAAAQSEQLDDDRRANLREMQRIYRNATALPEDLVHAASMAGAKCEHAWRKQRPENDWAGFAPNLREVVKLTRKQAEFLSQKLGMSKYDALMDRFEPGMTSAEVDRLFGDVKSWLPALIQKVIDKQANEEVIAPVGPFPIATQRALCERVMKLLSFDFHRGRLDVSTHPFSGGSPEDVRLTTRYRESEFLSSLMGTIHETGHGRYEQGRPQEWLGQPMSEARSMAIHESQSLSFEMQLGRSRAFMELLAPLLVEYFGAQPAFEPENLFRLYTRVKPGLIRVDADEVTYPAHVILRYEIERPLVEGEIEVDDIPALWDKKMMELLRQDTRGNYKDGPMQDIHWTDGAYGYFPCYTLGAMYASQWFATLRRAKPSVDADIARGDLGGVFEWLEANVWRQASRFETDELCRRASGSRLDPKYLRAHLETRYLG